MLSKEKIKKSIADGNLNPRFLGKFFDEIKLKAYSYDYNMQKQMVDYVEETVDFTSGQSVFTDEIFGSIYERVLTFNIGVRYVDTAAREKFKRSGLRNKWLTYHDINIHRDIFRYNVLVLVDGKMVTDFRIKAFSHKIVVALREPDFKHKGHKKLTVMFLPEAVISVASPNVGDFNGINMNYDKFTDKDIFAKHEKFIGFWINKETNKPFIIDNLVYDKYNECIIFNDLLPTYIDKYNLMLIGVDCIHQILSVNNTETWFSLNDAGLPIPKDNMMILIENNDELVSNDGSITINEFYPNYIRVDNPNRYSVKIIVLFKNLPHNEHIEYDNEIAYYTRNNSLIEEFKEGTAPVFLHEFKPIKWEYGTDDFLSKNNYNDIDFNNLWDSFLYKLETISSNLKKWAYLYQEYEKRTYGYLSGWYHRCSKEDLVERERINTNDDVEDEDLWETFLTPQYLFVYKHDIETGDANSFCFFIDGKYTLPTKIIIYEDLQFVYFPKNKFKENSVIEVERFDGISINHKFELSPEGTTIPMSKFTNKSTIANNLFLISPSGEYLNNGEIKTIINDEQLGSIEIDLNTSVFIVEPTASITFIPVNYSESEAALCCNNVTYQFIERESGNDFLHGREDAINLNASMTIGKTKQGIMHRLRIFNSEGRLIPKRSYYVYKQNNYFSIPKFNIPIPPGYDERFIVSYIGYDEALIYHKDNVPANGLVCLEGKTSRPVNLSYHDIYLNGYRLTKYDIEIIAPFTFIITNLKKFNTLDYIEIYEKVHIPDEFVKFDYDDKSEYPMDILMNKDEKFYNDILDKLETITPTGDVRDMDKLRDWLYSLFNEYNPYHYINADIRRDLEPYYHIFNDAGRFLINADDRVRFIKQNRRFWYSSHDKSIPSIIAGTYPTKNERDLELVEETIKIDESINVPEDEYVVNGYYRSDSSEYNRVYDNDFVPTPKEEFVPTENRPDSSIITSNKINLEEGKNELYKERGESEPYKLPDDYDRETPDDIKFIDITENYYKLSDVYPGIYTELKEIPIKDQYDFTNIGFVNSSYMFDGCKNLEYIPSINTYNATTMVAMFAGCVKLKSIGSLATFRCENFTQFMLECNSLPMEEIEKINFTSARITDSMFFGCASIKHVLDIDYSKLENMNSMYAYSGILDEEVTIDCSNIEDEFAVANMFTDTNVKIVHLENVPVEYASYMDAEYIGCETLYINGQVVE